jgi:hypothetical protein
MAQFHHIKFLHQVERLSQREIAKKLEIQEIRSRNIYRQRRPQLLFNAKRSIVIRKNIRKKLNGYFRLLINGLKMILNVGENKIIQLHECIRD